ncbi:MAG: hypothetical protein WCQ90_15340, partial [Deltaproteobacteria bacterium]
LIVIVDRNNIQIGGNTERVMPLGDLSEKYKSFGWNTFVVDGHDFKERLLTTYCGDEKAFILDITPAFMVGERVYRSSSAPCFFR